MKASVITLGCKVNEYESQSILNQLKTAGYEICEGLVYADVYVVNTCAVTNMAERKSRQMLTKIEKLNPKAKIVVCGCSVQNDPSKFLVNKNVLAVVGNVGKSTIVDFLNKQNKNLVKVDEWKYEDTARPIETRTRQFIKIQDGCDCFCTYCIIPYLRGRSRSRNLDDILNEIKNTSANEIVLTGINMSDYKIDGKLAFKDLVKEVDKLDKRFRISSIECLVLDDEMLEILKNCKNFCPHFHLSLQSACDATLKRMNRHYTIEQFKQIVSKIKKLFPSCSISTDIIVGFKGETDEEFAETLKNLKELEFSFMHIFPYSERTGTNACKLQNPVDKSVVKTREKILQKLNLEFKNKFFEKNIGQKRKVLIEEVDEKYSLGYTDNYIYTYIEGNIKVGDVIEVTMASKFKDGMLAVRR